MKGSHAQGIAAEINSQLTAARLNHKKPTPDSADFDPAKVQIDLIKVVQGLDDEARQRLQDAIDAAKTV